MGSGPLLQRDYWGFVAGCQLGAQAIAEVIRSRFWELAPPDLVQFRRSDGTSEPLEVGDELEVHIRFTGTFYVRVIHRDANSVTIGTLEGHPECGRITFGAYRHETGEMVVHIRSRARSSNRPMRTGFLAIGDAMQVKTWTDFVARLASVVGEGVEGFVYEETSEHGDDDDEDGPTFLAEGD